MAAAGKPDRGHGRRGCQRQYIKRGFVEMLDKLVENFKPLDIEALRPEGFYEKNLIAKQKDAKRITAGSGWEKWDLCPICGSAGNQLEFDFVGINIVRCTDCTHRYTAKVPVNLGEVYDSEDYENAVAELELTQQDYRINRFGRERADVVKGLFEDNKKTVLDIGCGWGYVLAFLQDDGFDCYGIELSKPVAEIARSKFNLNIADVPIEEYSPDMKFDAITMFGVIEHVKNPVEILSCCRRLLNDGGYVLMFTPNFESVAVSVQRENASMVYPGLHLHHFTRASIERAGMLAGLRKHSYCTKGIDIGDIYSYFGYKGSPEAAEFLKGNGDMLQAVIDESGCANHMRVVLAV
jgi:2-polyprenyl-3-methyl-5-hydroxy-6-metoxy-1,4-benzoquinol methylase